MGAALEISTVMAAACDLAGNAGFLLSQLTSEQLNIFNETMWKPGKVVIQRRSLGGTEAVV